MASNKATHQIASENLAKRRAKTREEANKKIKSINARETPQTPSSERAKLKKEREQVWKTRDNTLSRQKGFIAETEENIRVGFSRLGKKLGR